MSIFAQYADVLAVAQPDFHALLNPQSGFAPRIIKICRQRLEDAQDASIPQEIELARLELNTWMLLQALMAARKTSVPQPTFYPNPYTPTSTLAQAILRVSPLLTELVIVREWLHDTAAQPSIPEATTGYWSFTKHMLVQSQRMSTTPAAGIVDALDPDATSKSGGHLASDDASYERSLLQSLYAHIRAGRLEEAIELCRRAHQPWRAASIRGLLLFRWNAISTDPTDTVDDEDEAMDNYVWSGNRHRKLWKSTCTRAALNPNLPNLERTLYAALCPSPQTFPILRSACKTWEDHLWATLSVICEQRESAERDRLANYFSSFWEEQEQDGDDSGEPNSPPSLHPPPLPQLPHEQQELLTPNDESDWENEVFSTLSSLQTTSVSSGPPADHAFHFSQLHIMLGRTSTLLDVFAGGLNDGVYGPGMMEYVPLCRFFAHLSLYLGLLEVSVPVGAVQVVLEAYLRVLEDAGERHLIALYAGALGENAVERYALFLVSLRLEEGMDEGMRIDGVDGGDSIEERKRALLRAREHGLDVNRVAVVAAERSVDKAFELLPPTSTKGPLPSLVGPESDNPLQRPPSYIETFLVRSIEWTTFSEATYATALEQACVVLRFFLASGRLKLAQSVLDMLPAELAGISEPEERATEYLHYRQFFLVWESLERVVAVQALEIDMDMSRIGSIGASRETRAAWLSDYHNVLEEANEQVTRLLTAEWLVNTEDYSAGAGTYADKRRKEMIRVRRVFIPELVIRLHSLLYASRKWFPENLKRALNLANIVADSRYRLYDDFLGVDIDDELGPLQKQLEEQQAQLFGKKRVRKTRLGDYLSAVRQAVLGGLEGGGSDPFAMVAIKVSGPVRA